MTNQLRKIVKYVFLLTLLSNVVFLVFLLIPPIGFVSWISYLVFGFNATVLITFGIIIIVDKKNEKDFMSKIKSAKNLMKTHNDILMEFYKMNKIPPQYDKNGMLRDLDSLLGIVPEYDADGKPLPNIYDLLQIKPLFDEGGREVPTVLIIKHLIDKFKSKDLDMFKDVTFIRKPEEGEVVAEGSKAEKLISLAKVKKATEKPKTKAKTSGVLITPSAKYSATRFIAAPLLKRAEKPKTAEKPASNIVATPTSQASTPTPTQQPQPAQTQQETPPQTQQMPIHRTQTQPTQGENVVESQPPVATTKPKQKNDKEKEDNFSYWE